MDEDVLPAPPSVVAALNCPSDLLDARDLARICSSGTEGTTTSFRLLSALDDDFEKKKKKTKKNENNDDDDDVFLRVTRAHEWTHRRGTSKPVAAIQFVDVHDVIDASPNDYAQCAQRIERLKARCKEKRIGMIFCVVASQKDDDTKEDVTFALNERVVSVLTRLSGGNAQACASTKIVSLTRAGSDTRETCLRRLAEATEEVKQEVFVNEAKRAIEKCDAAMHAFEREVVESGVVDENELRLGRLEAKCKASRYLFKAASYAEFRGDCEAAMNALRECFERLIAFVDEVLPILLRGGFEQREENPPFYRRRLWRVCEALRVLTYCRSKMSSMQLGQILKTMDTSANSDVNKAIEKLARVEKEHSTFVKRCLSLKINALEYDAEAKTDTALKCFAAYRLALRAKADKSFADVLAHTMHANPNVYDAIFNDKTQFQRTTVKSTSFDFRLDPGFYYQSAFYALISRREFMQSSGLGKDTSVCTNSTVIMRGRYLGTFEDKSKTITGTSQDYIENHAGNMQIPSIELQRAYVHFENTFSPLEMLEKAKAYYEGNPRYGTFSRLLTAVSSDYALELFYANNKATNKEKILSILMACAETYRKEGWDDLLEETLERTLVCLGGEGETANADDSKYRMDILLELHGIQYRGGEHEGKTRASRLLAKGVTKTQSSSFSPVLEVSCESLASRAFKASCSFVYDTSRNDAIRAGDCVKLAVRYALQGLVEDDLFSVTKLEAHFSDGTKASTTTSTSEIVDEMVLIPFTVQSKTQREFVLEVDALDVITKSGVTFRFPSASLETLESLGHTKSISVKELAPRAELHIEDVGENDIDGTTILFGEKKTLTIIVSAVDGLADAIVNLSIDESLREISLGEDDSGEKKGEVIASFENPRIVIGSLSKGESKRVNANATFFSNRTTTNNNRKESRATISAHLTCNFGSPGQGEVSPSRHRVVAAENSKTFSFKNPLEVLDSTVFAACGTSPVSILITKDADNIEEKIYLNTDDDKRDGTFFNEGDVHWTNIRAKVTSLVVVDDAITTRLNPGDVYTQVVTEKNVRGVSWYREDVTQRTTKNAALFPLNGNTTGRRVEILNISTRVPEFVQVGVAFEYVVEMKNLDLNVPRDFMVSVKDAPGFVMAGESKTTKMANPGESCFLRLKIVAIASGKRFLPLISIACPKLGATWTNSKQQSVLVLPVAL